MDLTHSSDEEAPEEQGKAPEEKGKAREENGGQPRCAVRQFLQPKKDAFAKLAEDLRNACTNNDENLFVECIGILEGTKPGLIELYGGLPPSYQRQEHVINVKDEDGRTPLMLAVIHGCGKHLKRLVEELNADVNVEDDASRTALFWACYLNKKEMAEFLLQKRADPSVMAMTGTDLEGVGSFELNPEAKHCTPLMAACLKNHHELVDAILTYDRVRDTLRCKGDWSNTALHYAAKGASVECIKLLLAYPDHVDVNALNEECGERPDGDSPLWCAWASGFTVEALECMEVLIDNGATLWDPNHPDEKPPIMEALKEEYEGDLLIQLDNYENELEAREVNEEEKAKIREILPKLRDCIEIAQRMMALLEQHFDKSSSRGSALAGGKGPSEEGPARKKAKGVSKRGPCAYAASARKEPSVVPGPSACKKATAGSKGK